MKIDLLTTFGALTILALLPVESRADKPVTRRGTSVMHFPPTQTQTLGRQ